MMDPLLMDAPSGLSVVNLSVSPRRSTQTINITELPVEVLGLIFDVVDAQTRANARLAHPLLARGVWHVENKWAMECRNRGVTLPPKSFFRNLAKRGVGINYRAIRDCDVFGSNLAARCNRMLYDIIHGYFLPPLKDEEGNITHKGGCFHIQPQLLNTPLHLNFNATGKISMEFDLHKYGFGIDLLRTNCVRFKATISGVQLATNGDISVTAGLIHRNGSYNNYALMHQERKEGPDIPTWGKEIILKFETPLIYTTDGMLNALNLQITLMNSFALLSINIRATVVDE